MKAFKPDFPEHINIRLSKEMRARIREICVRDQLSESDAARFLLDAGMQIAMESNGLAKVMAKRSELLAGTFPPSTSKPGRKPVKKKPAKPAAK